jgi:alpha-beta hydrolase superfamily lysophospholipase
VRDFAARVAVGTLLLVIAVPAAADERVDITATDGVQLIGHLSGASGPGVVLVRDPARESRDVTGTAQSLAKRGFRVLRFDLRGHGESEGAADPATVDRDAEGAFRYLVGRKIRPVYLVGEGASGAPAVAVATRVAAPRVVVVGASSAPPSPAGVRVETLPGDLTSDRVMEVVATRLLGGTSD